MLATLGFLSVVLLLIAVMAKKLTPTVALIAVPTVMAFIAGFGFEVGGFITNGIKTIAPTGVMFIFAILFFGVLSDAGTFDPIIKKIIKAVGNDPVKIAVGTAILAMTVHLDGSGAVTFLVTIPAVLPLYDAIGMSRASLATIVALAAGTMNVVPWGGPTLRAATSLNVPVTDLFNPLLVPVVAGLITVLVIAGFIGKREKSRIGNIALASIGSTEQEVDPEKLKLQRPKLFLVNIILIIAAIGTMISNLLPPQVVFMFAFGIAVVVNYPNVKEQRARVDAHAKEALMMASVLFAAGAFTGIMKDTGMITAMSEVIVGLIPTSMGRFLPVVTGVLAMPMSLLFDPDSFYFGVMPVLTSTAAQFGVDPIMVGRAAILGQMTTGFPVSPLTAATFLLTGLAGVDLGEHQKKTIPFAFGITIVMLIVSIVIGVITF
ncbi:CitMHS family transporter [Sedimentibacter sp. MB31-C6]|uniref:CitMHS family transporter n=1 Tax=Sedimentibacter sp. MB31-C6 TaxID=3109366 RepID=UPI002DDDAB5E|nr:citrate:proton symporter [Sedimentibacter sp. MB36-C1]WSI03574.1 citrate:proton symporter [Sedimentibacter sp. MB36-C1]